MDLQNIQDTGDKPSILPILENGPRLCHCSVVPYLGLSRYPGQGIDGVDGNDKLVVGGGSCPFDILSYVCQGMRWSLLLHPIGRISTFQATEAIYAGLFVNEILPMRLGEVLRIYLVSRWDGRVLPPLFLPFWLRDSSMPSGWRWHSV